LLLNNTTLREAFEPLSDKVSKKLSDCKVKRDDLNMAVRSHLDKRNDINRQVKELISEVHKQKMIRNEANTEVKELKAIRLERSNVLKELRAELRSSFNQRTPGASEEAKGPPSHKIRAEMNKLERRFETGQIKPNKENEFFSKMKNLQKRLNETKEREEASSSNALKKVQAAETLQTEAHKSVERAVVSAQEAHDLMIELSEEVDRLRESANKEHLSLTTSKREADGLHNQYIVSLRCVHSMQDMMKLSESKQKRDEEDGKEGISELMARLMSGDTLSTEELMLLQRG
tara:strand:- start:427 stop:1293 length:867 start_codon:yes stop_codon:yes gene_type:complete